MVMWVHCGLRAGAEAACRGCLVVGGCGTVCPRLEDGRVRDLAALVMVLGDVDESRVIVAVFTMTYGGGGRGDGVFGILRLGTDLMHGSFTTCGLAA